MIILLIVMASLLTGWLLLAQWGTGKRPFPGDRSEQIFSAITLGVVVIGWLAFVLAELGWFTILRLSLLWIVLILGLGIRLWRKKSPLLLPAAGDQMPSTTFTFIPDWLEYAALIIWLAAASWVFFRPHQFVTGAADAGGYVNMAAEIAKNGSILIQDDLLASLDPALYPAFLRPLPDMAIAPYYILPGFYVIGQPVGEITPQFYHLHPAWQAVAFGLGDGFASSIQAELLLTGLWALLGALAVYLFVRRLVSWPVALLALAGLSINALQAWFARYPTTETLTQFLLWAGLWALAVWLVDEEKRPLPGLMAGLALGQSFLVRIDMLFVLPVLGLFGLWFWVRSGWKRAYNWFFLPLLLLILHSLLHALWQSSPYFFELFGFALRLLAANWIIPVGAVVGGLIMLVGLGRYRNQLRQLARWQRPLLIILAGGLLLLAVYGWFVRPYLGEVPTWNDPFSGTIIPYPNRDNLLRLGWYLSPVGVWLGILGMALLIGQVRRETAVALSISLLIALIYLANIRANPHQIYAMRRYVPATLPLFVIGAAYFIRWLMVQKKTWLTGGALLLALVWLGGLAWLSRGFISQVDYAGITPQLSQLSDKFEPDSILIFNDSRPIGQGDVLGTPLHFLLGHDVLTLRDPALLDEQILSRQLQMWYAEGRSLYWITVDNGHEWPLADWQVSPVDAYEVQAIVLEGTYERRPTRLENRRWQGEIAVIRPLTTEE